MALTFGRGKIGEGGGEMGASIPSLAPMSSGSGLTAFIDRGSEFEGKLSFKDTVRIDGRFVGEISSENTLIVGESGEIEAKIRSQVVEVSGLVTGDVTASRKLILHKTARLEGNVETAALVMEEGASLNGRLTMATGSKAETLTRRPCRALMMSIEGAQRRSSVSGLKARPRRPTLFPSRFHNSSSTFRRTHSRWRSLISCTSTV